MTGISAMPSCRAASTLAWPAIRPPSSPTSAGPVQPHSLMLAATQSSTSSSYQPTAIGPSLTRAGKFPACSSRQVCEGLKPVRFCTSGFRMIFRCLRAVRLKLVLHQDAIRCDGGGSGDAMVWAKGHSGQIRHDPNNPSLDLSLTHDCPRLLFNALVGVAPPRPRDTSIQADLVAEFLPSDAFSWCLPFIQCRLNCGCSAIAALSRGWRTYWLGDCRRHGCAARRERAQALQVAHPTFRA